MPKREADGAAPGFLSRVVLQIMVLDMVFSLDSVITAVGMAEPSVGDGGGDRHRHAS